jgi:hypothetical protein
MGIEPEIVEAEYMNEPRNFVYFENQMQMPVA